MVLLVTPASPPESYRRYFVGRRELDIWFESCLCRYAFVVLRDSPRGRGRRWLFIVARGQ